MRLKRIYIVVIIIASLALVGMGFIGGFYTKANCTKRIFYPDLKITGDVKNKVTIDNLDFLLREAELEKQKITYNHTTSKVFGLEKVINLSEPVSQYFSIYFVGQDGRTATISSEQIEGCYINFSNLNGWEAINVNHPVSSNIKNISEIIIVSIKDNREIYNYGLNVITTEENILNITPGEAKLRNRVLFDLIGVSYKESELEQGGNEISLSERFESSAYIKREILTIEDILEAVSLAELRLSVTSGNSGNIDEISTGSTNSSTESVNFVIMGEKGQYLFTNQPGYFEVDYNKFNYFGNSDSDDIEDARGIILNPVTSNITDVYYDALTCIENGNKVLFIITDGFGYHQFKQALKGGYLSFLESLESFGSATIKPALSVCQPVSNSGLAAMLTGKPPSENGIYSRKQRELEVPSIFSELQRIGKKSIFIEGNVQLIKTEIDPVLNTDMNGNGTIDDEIFKLAMESMKNNYDFMVVHFHSIDDNGHNFGDISEKTFEAIRTIDSFIEKLVESWGGITIITSDHGMHSEEDGGSHGQFRYEDLVVPYILINRK